jgi:uncharacterized membrane protein
MRHTFLRHVPIVRVLVPRPRLAAAIALCIAVYAVIPLIYPMHHAGRLLVGYNAGVWLYLFFVGHMMATASVATMRRRALTQDEGKVAILVMVVVSSLIALLAIGVELAESKDLHGASKIAHVVLAVSAHPTRVAP